MPYADNNQRKRVQAAYRARHRALLRQKARDRYAQDPAKHIARSQLWRKQHPLDVQGESIEEYCWKRGLWPKGAMLSTREEEKGIYCD